MKPKAPILLTWLLKFNYDLVCEAQISFMQTPEYSKSPDGRLMPYFLKNLNLSGTLVFSLNAYTSNSSNFAPQLLHWTYACSRFSPSQEPSAELHLGHVLKRLDASSTSLSCNASPVSITSVSSGNLMVLVRTFQWAVDTTWFNSVESAFNV
jgi:hypothetical protein